MIPKFLQDCENNGESKFKLTLSKCLIDRISFTSLTDLTYKSLMLLLPYRLLGLFMLF